MTDVELVAAVADGNRAAVPLLHGRHARWLTAPYPHRWRLAAIRFCRMTLVLSLMNESVAIHLSDRRLTGRRGPVTDEANKTIFLNAFDCRLVMGFSGLSRAGNIDIEERILNILL